ncbi:MAG: peptidoglycan-binding protein [Leptolyngbyaceae cyanobacterium SL_7_1]|nr:peptidoglycan-binding protein [Leptolyngbyaceae cyanobacterium SL_7_1]
MTYSINQFKAVLNGLGYNLGPNGIGGNQSNSLDFYTQAAIQEFQATHKLPITGTIDQPTVEKARQLMRNLKHSLNVAIEADLPINEYYGPRTHQAIMHFQRLRELPMTGIAGAVVRKELELKVKDLLRQQVTIAEAFNVTESNSFELA